MPKQTRRSLGNHVLRVALICFVAAIGTMATNGEKPTMPAGEPETLDVPAMVDAAPAAGRRVRQTPPEYAGSDVHHSLYLPPDWSADWNTAGKRWPVIVEYTGNYAPTLGSTGEVAGAGLGFGLCGGKGYIWVVMPYVARDHRQNERTWWGDEETTVAYCKTNLPRICETYGGDRRAVIVCGFSRGAIGVNYIGLHDDQIAAFWAGMVSHDHYDGVREWKGQSWGSPLEKYQAEARKRLSRLHGRPVLVCQNGRDGTRPTQEFIGPQLDQGRFTFLDVPVAEIFPTIPNQWFIHPHSDRWLLRDSPYRRQVWQWMNDTISQAQASKERRVGPARGAGAGPPAG